MKSFFHTRMEPLLVTDENNKVNLINDDPDIPLPKKAEWPIFKEDAKGNIEILYWTLERELITYYRMGDGKMSHVNAKLDYFKLIRLKEPKGDNKYSRVGRNPLIKAGWDATFPWYHPDICDKYQKGEEIETLFLTEGVFKAWLACYYGMLTVGLSSISHYAGEDGKLYDSLQRLILKCKVKNVVILWDGDCRNISKSALAKREDLAKRPHGFYSAAKKIRKLVLDIDFPKEEQKPAVYFYHVVSEIYPSEPKGLDDLLIDGKVQRDVDAIIKQALDPTGPQTFFRKFDISTTAITIQEHFGLHDKTDFWKRHREQIGGEEWLFYGDLVKWDEEKEEVKLIKPQWADTIFWVGDEYFAEVDVPGVNGTTNKMLLARAGGTLSRRLGKNFWRHLEHYEAFVNLPEHRDFTQVIEMNNRKFYNQYFPFRWESNKGEWQHIEMLIRHIFGEEKVKHGETGEKIERWQLGVDYIQQLYLNPTQPLPVLILYSPENQTGKSTFGHLIAEIFGDNVVTIGNDNLQSNFNTTYASKLVAICEETLLERKKEAEKIKAISTSPRIVVNPKGQKEYSIDFFCKFIFTSNNPRMIYVNRHDTRFWILQVNKLEKRVHNFVSLMREEIPAFLHHLENREPAAKLEGRMYFHDSLLASEAFEQTVRINEPGDATELRERIIELFIKDPTLDLIEMPMSAIREEFFGPAVKTKWVKEILRDYIMVKQKLNDKGLAKVCRGLYPRYKKVDGKEIKEWIEFKGRPYLFERSQFVSADEVDPKDYEEINDEERAPDNVPNTPLKTPVKDDLPF